MSTESDRQNYTGSLKRRYGHTPAQVNKSGINPFTITKIEIKKMTTVKERVRNQSLGAKNSNTFERTPKKGNESKFNIEQKISEEGNNSCDVTQSQDIKILESEDDEFKARVQKKGSQHYISLQQDPLSQVDSIQKQRVPVLPINSHNLNRLSINTAKVQKPQK